jgi:beta-glucosidase
VQTWPKSLDQLPPMMDYNIRNGRTYMYFKGEPLYPFGYGLTYTTFHYSNLRASSQTLAASGAVNISFDLKNTGRGMVKRLRSYTLGISIQKLSGR